MTEKQKKLDLPDKSDKNYKIVGYIVAAVITLAGIFFIYEILVNSDLTFTAQWNIFKSTFGNFCIGIGLLMAIVWWGKFTHWSAKPMVETRDSSGRVLDRRENMDITEQLFARILLPMLGHFVIEPIIYGSLIYYPIQCIIAVVGAIFPYILSVIVLGIIILFWMFTNIFHFRYQTITLIFAGVLFTGAFAWGGYEIQINTPAVENTDWESDGFDEGFDDALQPNDGNVQDVGGGNGQDPDEEFNEDEFE